MQQYLYYINYYLYSLARHSNRCLKPSPSKYQHRIIYNHYTLLFYFLLMLKYQFITPISVSASKYQRYLSLLSFTSLLRILRSMDARLLRQELLSQVNINVREAIVGHSHLSSLVIYRLQFFFQWMLKCQVISPDSVRPNQYLLKGTYSTSIAITIAVYVIDYNLTFNGC